MVPPCGTPLLFADRRGRYVSVVGMPRAPSPQRPAHHDHHLVDVRLAFARLHRVSQATRDVVLDQQQRDLVGGRLQRLDLLQHVQAVRLLVDEALQATGLSLDSLQPIEQEAPVLGVGVSEVLRIHTPGEYVQVPPVGQAAPLTAMADRVSMQPYE